MQGDTTRKDAGQPLPLPVDTVDDDGRVIPLPGLEVTAPCAPPAPTSPAPTRIGGYVLEGELGRGGMGVVYRARSVALGRRVALKTLRLAPGDVEEAQRFQTEARAAASLRHPNVVAVHEVGQQGGTLFLAMDLIEGPSLRARVQREGRLEPREAARVALGVARALDHAHGRGVLHRDVKPHNVLLAQDGTPLLTDFGLARQTDAAGPRITVTGQVMGTPAYMAPEQARGDARAADARTDVWGLGATLYELLVGEPPFAGASQVAVLRAVVEDDPRPPRALRPRLDADLETVCLRCLEKDPARRYPTAAALTADLERYLREEPILARRPGAAERLARWARRHRARVAAGLAVLMAALAGGAGAREHLHRTRLTALRDEWASVAALVSQRASPAEGLARAERAYDAARRWSEAAPDDAAARSARVAAARAVGDACRATQDWSRAAQAYDAAGVAEAVAWCEDMVVARALLAEGLLDEAAAALREAAARPTPFGDAQRILGTLRLRDSDAAGALQDLDRACELAPEDVAALVRRAEARMALGEVASAREDVDRALALAPDDVLGLYFRAALLFDGGQADAARADIERVLALEPARARAYALRGRIRASAGDLRGAVEDATRALELAPLDGAGWLCRAEARVLLGDAQGAAQDAERARRLTPRHARAWSILGVALLRLGRTAEAVEARRQAVYLDDEDPMAWHGLADALFATGDLAGALEALTRAVERGGGVIAHTDRSALRLQDGDLAGALADAREATARDPSWGRGWVALGEALGASNDLPGALRALDRAIDTEPDLAKAWWHRGRARERAGDLQGAAADLRRFLELAPRHAWAAEARERLRALETP